MNNRFLKLSKIALAITIVFSACKPEKKETVVTENYKGVFVVNEGGYGKANGSVGLYKPGTGEFFNAYEKANGRPLGDVVQSMTLIDGKYFIIVNNSNRIEVVNQSDFKSITTIPVNQPRNIIQVSASKAYVSQLNTNVMTVVNLGNISVEKTINVKSATDNMAVMGNHVYVGKAYADKLYLIDISSDKVTDSITVGSGLGSVVNIGTSQIGVFCLGIVDFSNGSIIENGKIAIINADSNKVERTIPLTNASYGGVMVCYQNELYYTFGDAKLFNIPANATSGAASPLITVTGSIYGVTIDQGNGFFYLMDAGDFNSAGKVLIFDSDGDFQKEFVAGIAPSKVVFNY